VMRPVESLPVSGPSHLITRCLRRSPAYRFRGVRTLRPEPSRPELFLGVWGDCVRGLKEPSSSPLGLMIPGLSHVGVLRNRPRGLNRATQSAAQRPCSVLPAVNAIRGGEGILTFFPLPTPFGLGSCRRLVLPKDYCFRHNHPPPASLFLFPVGTKFLFTGFAGFCLGQPFICDARRRAPQATYPGAHAGRMCGPVLRLDCLPPYLVLLRMGFSVPPPSPPERCALTAPFHPYRTPERARRYTFCCTFRRVAAPRR
jgi:hypothetical protein